MLELSRAIQYERDKTTTTTRERFCLSPYHTSVLLGASAQWLPSLSTKVIQVQAAKVVSCPIGKELKMRRPFPFGFGKS
jgi:hypothetical protein